LEDNTYVTDAIATGADLGAMNSINNKFYDSSDVDATATIYPETITTGGTGIFQIADRLGIEADTDAISAVLHGAAGIAAWPAGAVAANGISIAESLRYVQENQLPRVALHQRTFTACTDESGVAYAIFTVTGEVLARTMAHVTTAIVADCGNNGALSLGVEDNVAILAPVTVADLTNFAQFDVWTGETTTNQAALLENVGDYLFIGNGEDIEISITVEDIVSGAIDIWCQYIPISSDGAVVAV